MQNFSLVCAALGGCLLSNLSAQVVTVGGLNPDYVDLPAAVAGAAPGSVVLVRPGSYDGFTTNKPLRILLQFGDDGGSIHAAAGAAYAVTLSGMPADGTFVLAGTGAKVTAGSLGAIRIANTAGRVFVEGLTVSAGTLAAVDVQNAGPVHLHDCQLSGTPGLLVQNAAVVTNDVHVASPAGSAVAALNATLDLAGGSFAGRGMPALRLVGCGIRLAGDGTTAVKVAGAALPLPAIDAVNSVLQWEPGNLVLMPANGAAALSTGGTTTEITEDAPIVTAHGGPPGGTGSVGCRSNTPRPGLVVVAPFAPPVFLGLAGLYVDLAQSYAVPLLGIVDAQGLSLTFAVPATPSLLGDVSCVQGAVFDANGLPTLSGPAPLVTR